MKRTFYFYNKPIIKSASSVGGPKESAGAISDYINIKLNDDTFGEDTFERAESKMLYTAINGCLKHVKLKREDLDAIVAGDLLNQIIASTFSVRNFNCGYLGVYNACATFAEALTIGATLIDGGYLNNVVCASSSHFSSAERQYRYPLELGCIRPPQSQWTVTGAGACLLSLEGRGPKICSATVGKVVDYGVVDPNNLGAAMAPAACDTIVEHLKNIQEDPEYYDLIITGDLGALGSRILKDLVWEKGVDIEKNHVDCGEMIYNIIEDEFQGGSGAGCSAVVFSSYVYEKLKTKRFNKVLLCATGALLSTVSSGQGDSIPCVCHAVSIEND